MRRREELGVGGGAAGERGGDPAWGEAGELELFQQSNGKGSWISLGGGVGG